MSLHIITIVIIRHVYNGGNEGRLIELAVRIQASWYQKEALPTINGNIFFR